MRSRGPKARIVGGRDDKAAPKHVAQALHGGEENAGERRRAPLLDARGRVGPGDDQTPGRRRLSAGNHDHSGHGGHLSVEAERAVEDAVARGAARAAVDALGADQRSRGPVEIVGPEGVEVRLGRSRAARARSRDREQEGRDEVLESDGKAGSARRPLAAAHRVEQVSAWPSRVSVASRPLIQNSTSPLA